MRRSLAVVLVAALAAAPVAALSLHVHIYAGHDHPEHHHGPATHEHDADPSLAHSHHDETDGQGSEPQTRWEACDPGHHAVAFKMGSAHSPHDYLSLAAPLGHAMAVPTDTSGSALTIADVRVHGPPSRAHLPSRAPPPDFLA